MFEIDMGSVSLVGDGFGGFKCCFIYLVVN